MEPFPLTPEEQAAANQRMASIVRAAADVCKERLADRRELIADEIVTELQGDLERLEAWANRLEKKL